MLFPIQNYMRITYCYYRWKSLRSANPGTPKVRLFTSNYLSCLLVLSVLRSTANQRAAQINYYTEPDFGVPGVVFLKLCYLQDLIHFIVISFWNWRALKKIVYPPKEVKEIILIQVWKKRRHNCTGISGKCVYKVKYTSQ